MDYSYGQSLYDVTIQVTLTQLDREVAEEFVMAQRVTHVNHGTIEVVQPAVAPDKREAYRRAYNLVCAILDAGELADQYQLANIEVQEVGA